MIDNFLDRESEWRWRLNDEVPIPADVHPLQNPGLELTGPWHPLDMAFNALNSAAPMNMPDFEDASPSHFQPQGTPKDQPVGTFAALQNAKEILAGRWAGKSYEVVKKDKKRSYKINTPPQQVAHAPGSSAQHSRALRSRHRRWPTRPRPDCGGRSLGVQQLRRAEAARARACIFTSRRCRRPAKRSSWRSCWRGWKASSEFPPAPSRSRFCTRKAMAAAICRRSRGSSGGACWEPMSAAGTISAASSRCGKTTRTASFPIRRPSAWLRRT